jgi:uncharacterized protein YegL
MEFFLINYLNYDIMNKLIPEHKAHIYYGSISDNIAKFKTRSVDQKLSTNFPLYVDQLQRLRPLFERMFQDILNRPSLRKSECMSELNQILNDYPPQKKFYWFIKKALIDCNESVHFERNQIIKVSDDYRNALINISEFIKEYSGIDIPPQVKNFYSRPITPVVKEQTVVQKIETTPITEREIYLGNKAATMLPIMFVLDVSKSMSTEDRIKELNKGAKWFYKSMRTDEITRDCVEIGIITFGPEVIQIIKFAGIENQTKLFDGLSLEAKGEGTNIGAGMNLALEAIFNLKNEYSDAGLDYHQPWIVLITDCDGHGVDDYEIAAQKTSDVINQDKLVLFPIGVGTSDLKILKEFSPKRHPIKMKEKSFGQFFDWLKENALFISKSRPDEKTPLSSPAGWATL